MNRPLDLSRVGPRVALGAVIALVTALAALLGRVGSDAGWLAALGHVIVARGGVPHGVPFAAASTAHWPNALVLSEVTFDGITSVFGQRGLMVAQLVAVLTALLLLSRDARAGGGEGFGTGAALLLVALGASTSLAIARVQMFSLILFPALLWLLRSEARRPSPRIWWAVPLLALWSNVHGAALLGVGTLLVYLAVERGRHRPLESLAVAMAGVVALSLTPAGLHTVTYYIGLTSNVAVQRGEGLWGPLSLSSPLDLVMLLAVLLLASWAWRGGLRRWEVVMAAFLAALTVKADRDGVWLLFFLTAPAARSLKPVRFLRALTPVALAGSVLIVSISLARGPIPTGASPSLLDRAIAAARGTPVLADGTIDEQVAESGGRIWAGNPIDAFPRRVQAAYLSWLAGSRPGDGALTSGVHVVLVTRGGHSQALMARTPGFVATAEDPKTVLYERSGVVR